MTTLPAGQRDRSLDFAADSKFRTTSSDSADPGGILASLGRWSLNLPGLPIELTQSFQQQKSVPSGFRQGRTSLSDDTRTVNAGGPGDPPSTAQRGRWRLSLPVPFSTPSRSVSPRREVDTSTGGPPSPLADVTTPSRPGRGPRPKTVYRFAQPPPATRFSPRYALNLRPRVLLQLQRVFESTRPMPVYEVVPASTVSSRLLNRSDSAREVNKRKFRSDDIVVMRASDYGHSDSSSDLDRDDESLRSKSPRKSWYRRDVVGVIREQRLTPESEVRDSPRKPSEVEDGPPVEAEIILDDGTIWQASSLGNGRYEFVTTDDHGLQLRARWVSRPVMARRSSSALPKSDEQVSSGPAGAQGQTVAGHKYVFSTISAGSRRHPIIGSMTDANIEILDAYSIPSDSSWALPRSPAQSPIASEPPFPFDNGQAQPLGLVTTDPTLRKLLVVTGIWVNFRKAWAPTIPQRSGSNSFSSATSNDPTDPTDTIVASPGISEVKGLSVLEARRPTRTHSLPFVSSRKYSGLSQHPTRADSMSSGLSVAQSEFSIGRSAPSAQKISRTRSEIVRKTNDADEDDSLDYGTVRRRRKELINVPPALEEVESRNGPLASREADTTPPSSTAPSGTRGTRQVSGESHISEADVALSLSAEQSALAAQARRRTSGHQRSRSGISSSTAGTPETTPRSTASRPRPVSIAVPPSGSDLDRNVAAAQRLPAAGEKQRSFGSLRRFVSKLGRDRKPSGQI